MIQNQQINPIIYFDAQIRHLNITCNALINALSEEQRPIYLKSYYSLQVAELDRAIQAEQNAGNLQNVITIKEAMIQIINDAIKLGVKFEDDILNIIFKYQDSTK